VHRALRLKDAAVYRALIAGAINQCERQVTSILDLQTAKDN
jgi:hypothetical protein